MNPSKYSISSALLRSFLKSVTISEGYQALAVGSHWFMEEGELGRRQRKYKDNCAPVTAEPHLSPVGLSPALLPTGFRPSTSSVGRRKEAASQEHARGILESTNLTSHKGSLANTHEARHRIEFLGTTGCLCFLPQNEECKKSWIFLTGYWTNACFPFNIKCPVS